MKQLMAIASLATLALFGLTTDSEANGGGLFRRCRGGCDSGCASTSAKPAEVKYEERKVKVAKHVVKDVKYTYTVCVPVTKDEKRKVTVCTPTTREEDYTYTVMVPKTEERKVKTCTVKCVRETITEKVPVCRLQRVTCVDECGRCHTRLERVTCMEERTRCVVKRVAVEKEEMVKVTVCVAEQRKGKRTVCEMVRSEKEITVKVCTMERQQREGTRKVCETVWEEQTIRVPVCATTSCDRGCSHRAGLFRRASGCCN
ncbi:MAG: hypothetical protein HYR84_13435 [Planctomycetes bacterium]|nr:hypothetical protein [Planctomycetota bacterium]